MNKLIFLVILSAVVYFSNLGGTSIYILDEAKNAGCAMEMKSNGEWIVPTFNGQLRTDKPPLHYYCMRVAYSVFGVNSLAARLFSAIAGILMIIVVYSQVKKILNERTAFITALVLLSSIQLTIQFHLAVPDPYLILFITVALFSFYRMFQGATAYWKWFYLSLALGFLTKGLVALVLPGLIIFVFLLFTKTFTIATLKRFKPGVGILLFCVVALPWYILVGLRTDGVWLQGFFLEHNLGRYTSTMEGHRGFPLAPFVILIASLLPFSVFIFQSVSLAWKDRKYQPLLLFSLIVVLVFGGFFSLSKTILPSYPAPAIPFLAVILGYFLNHLENNFRVRGLRFSLMVNAFISLVLAAGAYYALNLEESTRELVNIAWIFLILPIGSVVGVYYLTKKKWLLFIYSWAGSWIVLGLLFFYVAYPIIDSKNPVAQSLPLIEKKSPDKIVAYRSFNPAYVFALQQRIDVVHTKEELQARMAADPNLLIITRKKYESDFPEGVKPVFQMKDLFERNETILLAN